MEISPYKTGFKSDEMLCTDGLFCWQIFKSWSPEQQPQDAVTFLSGVPIVNFYTYELLGWSATHPLPVNPENGWTIPANVKGIFLPLNSISSI